MLNGVNVDSDRRYRVAMEPAELWARISAVDGYQAWWPWLREFDGNRLETGEVWRCLVQPPLPYTVRFAVAIVGVVADQSVSATITGDIAGSARLDISPTRAGCEVRLVSSLQPANLMLRTAALVARPLVRFGHNWVLDTGARQITEQRVP